MAINVRRRETDIREEWNKRAKRLVCEDIEKDERRYCASRLQDAFRICRLKKKKRLLLPEEATPRRRSKWLPLANSLRAPSPICIDKYEFREGQEVQVHGEMSGEAERGALKN